MNLYREGSRRGVDDVVEVNPWILIAEATIKIGCCGHGEGEQCAV